MAIEKAYSMIKPDGVANHHIGEIIHRIERAGLTIERMEMGMVTKEQAEQNYAEHKGKPFYDGLISYITSGPVVKMVVSGEGAVAKMRSLMGATDPAKATRTSSVGLTPSSRPIARSASSSTNACVQVAWRVASTCMRMNDVLRMPCVREHARHSS